ncbi:hypothetical protein NEFER03_1167 [Nematocida sp. LUAm3]|nr:hypothetical protein NEFER03_1167 [Nematocida sp. LUAm3]KAI5175776.1 hypothetical protein NEFER02_1645 [Nematocida sp. LUAm2]KAI5178272.1 hypothetical protein NEFER01_1439 [Nematocida sp. LUAm1]
MPERRKEPKDNHIADITDILNEKKEEEHTGDYLIDGYSHMSLYKEEEPQYSFPPNEKEREFEDWKNPSEWGWQEKEKEKYEWEEKTQRRSLDSSKRKTKFRICTNCGTTSTPSWRRSTNNKMLLCNACGLYQKLHGSDRPFSVTPDGKTKAVKSAMEKGICRGCGITQTPLWRRGHNNEWLCGSCGLLYTKKSIAEEYPGTDAWKNYPKQYSDYQEWNNYPPEEGSSNSYQPKSYRYDEDKEEDYYPEKRFDNL